MQGRPIQSDITDGGNIRRIIQVIRKWSRGTPVWHVYGMYGGASKSLEVMLKEVIENLKST